jgi:hypothetical protein
VSTQTVVYSFSSYIQRLVVFLSLVRIHERGIGNCDIAEYLIQFPLYLFMRISIRMELVCQGVKRMLNLATRCIILYTEDFIIIHGFDGINTWQTLIENKNNRMSRIVHIKQSDLYYNISF